jgi:hypothetical protein
MQLIFAVYLQFLAYQECQLNQRRRKTFEMKEAALDVFNNGGMKDLA